MQTTPIAKAEQVAAFLICLVFTYREEGCSKFTFFLDNARTHKKKMKELFAQHLEDFGLGDIKVEFVHIPPYSPVMNAAEYFIQLIRKKFLKNIPPNQSIEQVVDRLIPNVQGKHILNRIQMQNIITRIKRTPSLKRTSFIVD